jgi:hypothetical protein
VIKKNRLGKYIEGIALGEIKLLKDPREQINYLKTSPGDNYHKMVLK